MIRTLVWMTLTLGCGSSDAEEPASARPPPSTVGDETETTDALAEPSGETGVTEPVEDTGVASADEQRQPSGAADSPPQYACRLASNYNECIVERLEGRADTEAELVALIQSYRMLGRNDEARSHMEEFIARYPDSPQTQTYRDYLGGF